MCVVVTTNTCIQERFHEVFVKHTLNRMFFLKKLVESTDPQLECYYNKYHIAFTSKLQTYHSNRNLILRDYTKL